MHTFTFHIDANCSSVLQSRDFRVYRLPVRCEVSLARRHPQVAAQDLITAEASFHVQTGKINKPISLE